MSTNFIDRDPIEMMRYAKDAKSTVTEMTKVALMVDEALIAAMTSLDAPSRSAINVLHGEIEKLNKEMLAYYQIADDIDKKGKKLAEIQQGGL